ncbi:class I adenylate-forming enzyme family protein [Streptomyces axinellae]|uniref:ATP-dependent acyl-CoA ligase n=1 Tax=Streptomyces axinellae TaxID=552788 RepID=A0ABN3QQ69_9ACTN
MIPAHISTGRELWNWRVQQSPNHPFLRFEHEEWTYAEFDEAKARYAAALAGLDVGPGVYVLVAMGNTTRALLVHLALIQLGAVVVPLQNDLAFDELRHQINHSEAEILLADGPVSAVLLSRAGEFRHVRRIVTDGGRAGGPEFADWESHEPLPFGPLEHHDAHSPAMVLYTSGSSGKPKGVVLDAAAFVCSGAGFATHFGFTAEDVYFLPLPLAHAVGALTAPAMVIAAGGTLALADRFSPSAFWQQTARSMATCSILFPAHLNLLLETEKDAPGPGEPSLRLVITHAWNERFAARFGVELATVWGMTETGAMATGSAPGAARDREPGYVGTPMPDVEVAVFNADGERLPAGQLGEIRLRHPHVMLGYLRDPDATAEALIDGWVVSGDLGEVRPDGAVYFLGRKKNMIKRSGENIGPGEIEDALLAHPAVVEAIAFGVADEVRSEEVAAVVVVRSEVGPEDLLATASEHLAPRKLPRYLQLSTEYLPRRLNGKIDRSRIVEEFSPEAVDLRAARPREGRTRIGPQRQES